MGSIMQVQPKNVQELYGQIQWLNWLNYMAELAEACSQN